jgi:hypothetical protein
MANMDELARHAAASLLVILLSDDVVPYKVPVRDEVKPRWLQ